MFKGILATIVFSTIFSSLALASRMETGFYLGSEYSDNIFKVINGKKSSEYTLQPGINFDYMINEPNYDFLFLYNVSHLIYRHQSFDDRTDFEGRARLNWSISSNRMNWISDLQSKRITISSLDVDIPYNLTTRHVFQTGPSFSQRLGATDKLYVQVRYIKNYFEDTDIPGGEYYNIDTYLNHLISNSSTINFGVKYSDARTELQILEAQKTTAYLSYRYLYGNYNFNITAGINKIKTKYEFNVNRPYINAAFNYRNNNVNLNIFANRELTDSSIGLSLNSFSYRIDEQIDATYDQYQRSEGNDGNISQSDFVDRKRFEARFDYNFSGTRTQLKLRAFVNDQDYLRTTGDIIAIGSTAAVEYRWSYSVRSSIGIEQTTTEYRESIGNDNDTYRSGFMEIRYQFSKKINTSLKIKSIRRDFDYLDDGYDETVITFKINAAL